MQGYCHFFETDQRVTVVLK